MLYVMRLHGTEEPRIPAGRDPARGHCGCRVSITVTLPAGVTAHRIRVTGGGEPQFRAGFEMSFGDEPAAVIEELLKACNGAVVESAGYWKVRVGPPALPVYFFTDDDVLVSRPQDLDPFPGLDQTYNAVHARYPEPASMWEPKDAPPRYNADFEAADGGRRLPADLSLPAAPFADQVQRLMLALERDHRRMIRHSISLPPEAAILEPLDTVAWTSARNGYIAKLFEVSQVADDPLTLVQSVALREVDPADSDWSPGFELPSTIVSPVVVVPSAPGVAMDNRLRTDDLQVGAVETDRIAAGAVVRGGVAGSGAVTNNSSTWTTVASFTLSGLPVGSFVQGTLAAAWTHPPSSYPADFAVRVTVGGTVVVSLPRATLITTTEAVGRVFVPFTRSGIPPGTFDVVFEIQNAGGQGVANSNLQAIAVMR